MKFFFLGGIFPNSLYSEIIKSSRGVVQYAADTYQKKLLLGLGGLLESDLVVVNLPFVGSFPKRFNRLISPSSEDKMFGGTRVVTYSFVNLFFLKLFFRFITSLFALLREVKPRFGSVVVVYSAHMPFIASALILKNIFPRLKLCVIIPDLPQFMGGKGFFHQIFKYFEVRLFQRMVVKFDYFVVLASGVIDILNLPIDRSIVIEGIAVQEVDLAEYSGSLDNVCSSDFVNFLYTGTLAGAYGIRELLAAFKLTVNPSFRLIICGEGDSVDVVSAACVDDSRILYLGQVDRSQAVYLQNSCDILVNPRQPVDNGFTDYSFPSKIMEYMASGRPVVMYKLLGIPDEYDAYYFRPSDYSISALCKCFENVASLSPEYRDSFGSRARSFILSGKSPEVQAAKIIDLIN